MTITKEKRAEYETLLEYLGRARGTSLCRESAVVIRELLAEIDTTFPQGRAAGLEEEREAFEDHWIKAGGLRLEDYDLDYRPDTNTYADDIEQGAWEAWQARAALSSLPSEEAQGDARDAARYRWLRDMDMLGNPSVSMSEIFQKYAGGAIDAAIDNQMYNPSSLEAIGKGEKG